VLFVATAQAFDDEMRDRIAAHRAARPDHWDTLEAPTDTGAALAERLHADHYDTVVVDCMTLLASNILLAMPEDAPQADVTQAVVAGADALIAAQTAAPNAALLIVSNEVGMGVVPPTRLGRFYRDALGRANQQLAGAADNVLLFVAGLPWALKGVAD
ncbi:MAG: bifunctional adenosylcobinamide kinase/adenosylcobinamide-phosphate guanylyltransferase, partial [Chloroflexota bacterium]